MFYKLKRTWTHNDLNYIPKFKETFPELKHLNSEELCDRFSKLNVNFYSVNKESVKPIVRLTLPFAIILMILMFLMLPLNFIITGKWRYDLGKTRIVNWWKSLGIYF